MSARQGQAHAALCDQRILAHNKVGKASRRPQASSALCARAAGAPATNRGAGFDANQARWQFEVVAFVSPKKKGRSVSH
jgi:hypothetical protein